MTNYLDITLNLNNGSHCPYRKPNEVTMLILRLFSIFQIQSNI